MRSKNSFHQDHNLPSENHSTLVLDPTTNAELHLNIWKKLKEKIESHNVKNTTPSVDFSTRNIFSDEEIYDNISKERRFGQDMRRLISLVCRAFLNPRGSNVIRIFTPF